MGAIPGYLLNFARKILKIEASLHQSLIEFRNQYTEEVQDWIKGIMDDNFQTFVDETKLF